MIVGVDWAELDALLIPLLSALANLVPMGSQLENKEWMSELSLDTRAEEDEEDWSPLEVGGCSLPPSGLLLEYALVFLVGLECSLGDLVGLECSFGVLVGLDGNLAVLVGLEVALAVLVGLEVALAVLVGLEVALAVLVGLEGSFLAALVGLDLDLACCSLGSNLGLESLSVEEESSSFPVLCVCGVEPPLPGSLADPMPCHELKADTTALSFDDSKSSLCEAEGEELWAWSLLESLAVAIVWFLVVSITPIPLVNWFCTAATPIKWE